MQIRVRDDNGSNERWENLASILTGVKPPDFPNVSTAGGLTTTTQHYTQKLSDSDTPANFMYTNQQLYDFLVSEYGLGSGGSSAPIGDYDAAANTPDLEAGTGMLSRSVYEAITAGDFFSESIQVGDVLIAKIDAPTSLSDWIIINKNIPDVLASSETVQGIIQLATQSEVNTGTNTTKAVTPATLKAHEDSHKFIQGGVQIGATLGAVTITHSLNTQQISTTILDSMTFKEYNARVTPLTVNTATIEAFGDTVTTVIIIQKL